MANEECCSFRFLLILFISMLLLFGIRGDSDVPNLFEFAKDVKQAEALQSSTENKHNTNFPSQLNFFTIKEYHDLNTWKEFWVDLSTAKHSRPWKSAHNEEKVSLPFQFPFYKHLVENIIVSQRGFLNFDDNENARTIYIAPLLTGYDSSWNKSKILYSYEKNHFTIQWEHFKLGSGNDDNGESTTFQCTLFSDGNVIFAYKQVPVDLNVINEIYQPIRVGILEVPTEKKISDENIHYLLKIKLSSITNFSVISLSSTEDYFAYDVNGQEKEVFLFRPVAEYTIQKRDAPSFLSSTPASDSDSFFLPEEYDDESQVSIPPEYDKPQHDHHSYYNSTIYTEPNKWQEFWVDIDSVTQENIHIMLSSSYRKGVTVTLSFDFPFYGHLIRNVTVTTGGFVFTGTHVHSWLAATQYIAPLMANFDPSLDNRSVVKYADNGTAFTVEWKNVILRDYNSVGYFTFQTTLLKSGDIVFVYKQVPLSVLQIRDEDHPVKVGLSDAYIIDRTVFFLRRKTIYEYHRVDLKKPIITNLTSIYFTALPTCSSMTDCQSCISSKIVFDCTWCSDRCSDGMDRKRQDWILQGCRLQSEAPVCPKVSTSELTEQTVNSAVSASTISSSSSSSISPSYLYSTLTADDVYQSPSSKLQADADHISLGTTGIVGVLFVLVMVISLIVWIFYAYRNPHTTSGQLLIKYRPSQWQWPRGEARYTAASVHM